MKEPLRTRYVPGYDLFKLIVAIILVIILIMLLLRERDGRYASLTLSATQTVVAEAVLPTAVVVSSPTSTSTPEPVESKSTEIPATETPVAELPSTETPATEETPADSQTASDSDECPSNPTRIQVGFTVRVLDWLNFRAAPGLGKTIQHTNRPGTQMEVIGGPVCTPQGGNPPRAYLWWNVRMEDGREGWSAEAPLNFPNYFLEPVE
jgi:hypothetical protein